MTMPSAGQATPPVSRNARYFGCGSFRSKKSYASNVSNELSSARSSAIAFATSVVGEKRVS